MTLSYITTPAVLRPRPSGLASATIPLLAGLLQIAGTQAAVATPLAGEFGGGATAAFSQAVAGPLAIRLGNAAREGCPCRGTNGVTRSHTLSGLNAGPGGSILSAAESVSTAYGGKTAASATTLQTSTITKTSLLGGLITADTIEAAAAIDATPDKLTPSDTGSRFVNLVVAGKPIDPNVAANTVITLAGVGSVTLRAEKVTGTGREKLHLSVEMVRIDILQTNSLGLPVGAVIVVSDASAGFNRTQPVASLAGGAFGSRVSGDAGSLLQETLSAGASVGIPNCAGTGGVTKTRSVTALDVPHILSVGTETVTAFGGPSGAASVARTTANIEKAAFLDTLITVKTITAVAQDSRTGKTSTPSTVGSKFGGLTIAGVPIKASTPPNTTIPLVGLGYVVVNEQLVRNSGHVDVNGLHIVINTGNLLGLPVGTEIVLAHAAASATRF